MLFGCRLCCIICIRYYVLFYSSSQWVFGKTEKNVKSLPDTVFELVVLYSYFFHPVLACKYTVYLREVTFMFSSSTIFLWKVRKDNSISEKFEGKSNFSTDGWDSVEFPKDVFTNSVFLYIFSLSFFLSFFTFIYSLQ